jgi:hypothetical protein
MTEAQWMACADPVPMLDFLGGRASERKLRLFACARCRRIWNLLKDVRSRKAVEVAERFADGTAIVEEFTQAGNDANYVWNLLAHAAAETVTDAETDASDAACSAASFGDAAIDAALAASHTAAYALSYEGHQNTERHCQCDLLRDLFGNPFRPVSFFFPARLTTTVSGLAQGVYDDRAYDRMPILGDALEEAGCTERALLDHCRGPSPHVRGCWVVDLILGRG